MSQGTTENPWNTEKKETKRGLDGNLSLVVKIPKATYSLVIFSLETMMIVHGNYLIGKFTYISFFQVET